MNETKNSTTIRVELPAHLRTLAHVGKEIALDVESPVTLRSILNALESRYPMLSGTIRDHVTLERRPFLRFFACQEDWSHESPAPITSGTEPFLIVGAIAGG
jgi:molybdopterin synthase sulfur carrier subunit